MADPGPYETLSFIAGDGYRWCYRRYPPLRGMKAKVVCVHGIQSHAGWYEHSCNRFAKAGYDTYFLDRRGSGVNKQDRGDAPGFRRLMADLAEFLRSLRTGPGSGVPIFLVAISWGGKLATALERRWPGLIDGLVLVCPGFFPQVRPSLRERLGILASRVYSPRRFFDIPLNDPALFTQTPRWQEFLRRDPLSLKQATARLLIESVRLDGYLRVVPPHVRVPVLLLLAEKDQIIRNDRTRAYVERFATNDKQIFTYPGAAHTLEFEPDPDSYVSDILAWLDRHLQ